MEVIDLDDESGGHELPENGSIVIDVASSDEEDNDDDDFSLVEVKTSLPVTNRYSNLSRPLKDGSAAGSTSLTRNSVLDLNNWLSSDSNADDSFVHLLGKVGHIPGDKESIDIPQHNAQQKLLPEPITESFNDLPVETENSFILGRGDQSKEIVNIDTTFDDYSKLPRTSRNSNTSESDNEDDVSFVRSEASSHAATETRHPLHDEIDHTSTPLKVNIGRALLPMPLFMKSSQELTEETYTKNDQLLNSSFRILQSSPQGSSSFTPNPPSENFLHDNEYKTHKSADDLVVNAQNNISLELSETESFKDGLVDVAEVVSKPMHGQTTSNLFIEMSDSEPSCDELNNPATTAPRIIQLSDPILSSQSSPIKPVKRTHPILPATRETPSKRAKSRLTPSNLSLPELDILYSAKDLQDANRVTRKRLDLMTEMVIKIPQQVYDSLDKPHLKEVFEEALVEPYLTYLPLISWHRKLKARYDARLDVFIPCSPHTGIETHKVLYYKATDFCDKLMLNQLKYDCTLAIAISKQEYEAEYLLTIMIEGYDQFLSKLRNSENTQYKSQVLDRLSSSRGNDSSPPKTSKKRNDCLPKIVAKDVENRLNQTQLELGINIFPVRTSHEAVDWLASQTYTIAWSLYDKHERNHSLANLGLVRSGSDPKSTFLQSIRQFKFMTEAKADKLYCVHQSLPSIFAAFKDKGTLGRDNNGKNIVPPSVEIAMKKLFLSTDPDEFVHE